MKTFVICLVALAAMTETCVGLNCYQCIGSDDCPDPFNTISAAVQQCSPNEDRCTTLALGDFFTRGCTSSSNCTTNGCVNDICLYCCEGDLCNSQSIDEGTMDTLQCYFCFDSLDSPDAEDTSSCGEAFDPNDDELLKLPCDGKCMISNLNFPFGEGKLITRGCVPRANVSTLCGTECNDITCTTCCSDNLCNDGPLPVPPTDEPSGTRKTMLDQTLAKGLLLILLVAFGFM